MRWKVSAWFFFKVWVPLFLRLYESDSVHLRPWTGEGECPTFYDPSVYAPRWFQKLLGTQYFTGEPMSLCEVRGYHEASDKPVDPAYVWPPQAMEVSQECDECGEEVPQHILDAPPGPNGWEHRSQWPLAN